MKAEYQAKLKKQLEIRRRQLLARKRAAAARRRAARRAKAKAMRVKCKAKGGKFSKGRCIAMNRRYRFNKFCKKGKKGQVCRIVRSCRRGQARSKMERTKCRRIYKRWRVSWMRY
jgi:hypothetical protein